MLTANVRQAVAEGFKEAIILLQSRLSKYHLLRIESLTL